ncbi:MAG: hypothetical protein LBT30_01490 [Clostridiales bacterium]|jgi:hypothetical protein|nr:hypothetical protein [Clostridiales bacterium]
MSVRNKYPINLRMNTAAPTGTFSNAKQISTNTFCNDITLYNPSFSWPNRNTNEPDIAAVTLNGQNYTKNSVITAEGTNTLVISTVAGKSTTYQIIIDYTVPTNTPLQTYTNQAIYYSATDTNDISKIYYRKGSGNYNYTTHSFYTVTATEANNGTWYFYAEDIAGNTSTAVNCTLDTVAPVNPSMSQYTNQDIRFNPSDATSGVSAIYYRKGEDGNYSTTFD